MKFLVIIVSALFSLGVHAEAEKAYGVSAITEAKILDVQYTQYRCAPRTRCAGGGAIAKVNILVPLNGCLDSLLAYTTSSTYQSSKNVAEVNLAAWNAHNPESNKAMCIQAPAAYISVEIPNVKADTKVNLNLLAPTKLENIGPFNQEQPVSVTSGVRIEKVKTGKTQTEITLDLGPSGCDQGVVLPLSYSAVPHVDENGVKRLRVLVSSLRIKPEPNAITCLGFGNKFETIRVNGSYKAKQVYVFELEKAQGL